MKVAYKAADDDAIRVVLDLETRISTTLGAALTFFDRDTTRFLTPSGWSTDRALLQPTIHNGKSTTLELQVSRQWLPQPGASIEVQIPTVGFFDEIVWPQLVAPSPPADVPPPKAAAVTRPSLKKVLETLEIPEQAVVDHPRAVSNPVAPDIIKPEEVSPASSWRSRINRHNAIVTASALLAALGIVMMAYGYRQSGTLANGRDALDQQHQANSADLAKIAAERARLSADKAAFDVVRSTIDAQRKSLSLDQERLKNDRAQLDLARTTLTNDQRDLQNGLDQLAAERKSFEEQKSAQPAQTAPALPPPANIPRETIASLAPAIVTPTPSSASTGAELVAACDQLAANPTNRDKGTNPAGVPWTQLDSAAAIAACEKARDVSQTNSRVWYQLARAYHRAGNEDRARDILSKLVEQQYPAAFDNAGALEKDFERSVWLFRRGGQLGDPDCMDSLASLLLRSQTSESYSGETYALLTKAAELGSTAARKRLDQLNTQAAQNARVEQGIGNATWTIMTLRRFIR